MIVTGHVHVCEMSRERLREMMFRNLCLYEYCACVSVGLCIHVLLILLLRVLSLPFAGCFTGYFVFFFKKKPIFEQECLEFFSRVWLDSGCIITF